MKSILKIFLKILIVLTIVVFIFIGIPLILLSMKTEPPLSQYVVASEHAFYSALDQELTQLIEDDDATTVSLTINEAFINRMIQKTLTQNNPSYLDPDSIGQIAHDYMLVSGSHLGFKGVWTELSDNQLKVIAGGDYVVNGSPIYQSGLVIIFDIVLTDVDGYFLRVSEINIGKIRLPLRTAMRLAQFIVNSLTQKSLNEMILEYLSFGEFDYDDLTFTVSETQLTDYLFAIEPTFAALLKVVYQESLIVMDLTDEGFEISLQVGVFRRLTTDLEPPIFDRWESNLDQDLFMVNLASKAIINSALNPLDPRMELTEIEVNQIIDYSIGEDVGFDYPIEFTLDDEIIRYQFKSTQVFIRMNDDILSIHLKMSLTKEGLDDAFELQFNMSTTVSMNAQGDMVLTLIEANIGEVILDEDILETLFSLFDETLWSDGTIIIPQEKLNTMFTGSHIVIHDSYVINGNLRLHFGLES
jgi:hypothetical protein